MQPVTLAYFVINVVTALCKQTFYCFFFLKDKHYWEVIFPENFETVTELSFFLELQLLADALTSLHYCIRQLVVQ